MLLNSRQFKFLKNYGNVNVKSSAKRADFFVHAEWEFTDS